MSLAGLRLRWGARLAETRTRLRLALAAILDGPHATLCEIAPGVWMERRGRRLARIFAPACLAGAPWGPALGDAFLRAFGDGELPAVSLWRGGILVEEAPRRTHRPAPEFWACGPPSEVDRFVDAMTAAVRTA